MVFAVRDKLSIVLDNLTCYVVIRSSFTLVLLNFMCNKGFDLFGQLIVFSSFSEKGFNVENRRMDMSTVLKVCTYYICMKF